MRSAVDHQATAASAKQQPDQPEPGARGGERGGEPALLGRGRHAAQAKLEVENAALASYSMPKALMRERVARAMFSSDATG